MRFVAEMYMSPQELDVSRREVDRVSQRRRQISSNDAHHR